MEHNVKDQLGGGNEDACVIAGESMSMIWDLSVFMLDMCRRPIVMCVRVRVAGAVRCCADMSRPPPCLAYEAADVAEASRFGRAGVRLEQTHTQVAKLSAKGKIKPEHI